MKNTIFELAIAATAALPPDFNLGDAFAYASVSIAIGTKVSHPSSFLLIMILLLTLAGVLLMMVKLRYTCLALARFLCWMLTSLDGLSGTVELQYMVDGFLQLAVLFIEMKGCESVWRGRSSRDWIEIITLIGYAGLLAVLASRTLPATQLP